MNLEASLEKTYEPKAVEAKWYEAWEAGGHFSPNASGTHGTFTITIPPPNVTGELHMGHALQHAIHDAVIRWKRMQGFETLCLPGTDHAGIATQNVVEKHLKKDAKRVHL